MAKLTSLELLEQSEDLRQQAESLKAKEIPEVVARMKKAIAHYGLTAQQLGLSNGAASASKGKGSTSPGNSKKVSAKNAAPVKKASVVIFRDEAGHSWTGFGPRPKWLKDALAAGVPEESLRVSQRDNG